MTLSTLNDYLAERGDDQALADVIGRLARACAEISGLVRLGALAGTLGSSGRINVQDEEQKALDLITNDILLRAMADCPAVAGAASEEMDSIVPSDHGEGPTFLVLFDPLDGSSNIEVNVSVGTIFSVLPAPAGQAVLSEADFLQPGSRQRAAGYVVYGPQTMLVLTLGDGVRGFTLDADGAWRLTHPKIAIARETREFAINMSNRRHWAPAVRSYIEGCLAGREGPRGKDFNMRWVASMVADVHRVLMRGGVFLYPWDSREPDRAGKLRLMYEANPMSLLVEQAGGQATDCRRRTLDIQPGKLHERVAVALGSAAEIDEILAAHAAED